MDIVFVPYGMVQRITITGRDREERRVGFQLERSMAALELPGPVRES